MKVWLEFSHWLIHNTTTTSIEPDVAPCSVSVVPLQHKLFCLHVFRQAGPPLRQDCLAPRWETALSVFPKDTASFQVFPIDNSLSKSAEYRRKMNNISTAGTFLKVPAVPVLKKYQGTIVSRYCPPLISGY